MTRWLTLLSILAISVPLWAVIIPFGTPVIDGAPEGVYGSPLSEDPSDSPQGNANMDMGHLFACYDNTNVYFCITVYADITTVNWGKYILAFDTDNLLGSGASNDPWGRNVNYGSTHQIEYSLNTWVDEPPFTGGASADHQFWTWSGAAWTGPTFLASGSMALSYFGISGLEFAIPLSTLGITDPHAASASFWVTAWPTGGGGADPAQDQIPSGWTATDWSTTAQLNNFIQIGGDVVGLPVNMTSFTATPSANQVTLSWRVESETNNTGFRIFRSTGLNTGYQLVSGLIAGRGTTSEHMDYSWIDRSVTRGVTYYYRISDVDGDGVEYLNRFTAQVTVADPSHNTAIPKVYLMQNAPNPFNNTTNIGFSVTTPEVITLTLHDLSGRLVKTIASGSYSAGTHHVTMHADGIAAGMYFYKLKTESGFTTQKKLAYLK